MIGNRILFVDDDANVLSAYRRSLHKKYEITTCLSGDEGLAKLEKEGPYAVVVADMQMPGMNGIQFLQKAQAQSPETVRLMLTGNADQKTAADAVNQGHVFSFLTKPCPPESLEVALSNALKQYRLVMAEKELLEQTLNGAIKVLTEVLSMMDPQAFGRAERLRNEMKAIARWFKAPRPWELELGAMLSQIGYVAVPQPVLMKARAGLSLTGPEKDMLARVPESGAELLQNIPRLESVAEMVRYQHKNFDGSGHPLDGTAGEGIPVGARILRVLNELLDAEKANRTRQDAFRRMQEIGGAFDPKVLEAVAACFDIYLDKAEAETTRMESVRVTELTVGSVLAEDITTTEGALIVPSGTQVTPPLLQKLRNFAELSTLKEPIVIRGK
jgi:response regulator RpfG family c-di-GMP phosphodiesterase